MSTRGEDRLTIWNQIPRLHQKSLVTPINKGSLWFDSSRLVATFTAINTGSDCCVCCRNFGIPTGSSAAKRSRRVVKELIVPRWSVYTSPPMKIKDQRSKLNPPAFPLWIHFKWFLIFSFSFEGCLFEESLTWVICIWIEARYCSAYVGSSWLQLNLFGFYKRLNTQSASIIARFINRINKICISFSLLITIQITLMLSWFIHQCSLMLCDSSNDEADFCFVKKEHFIEETLID